MSFIPNPIFSGYVRQSGAVSTLLDGIISHWKLEEENGIARDSLGANHVAAYANPVAATGKIGSGRAFVKASNQFLMNASPVNMPTNSAFTICGWVKWNSLTGIQDVFSRWHSVGNNRGWLLSSVNSNSVLSFFTSQNGTTGTTLTYATTRTIGTWYFVAIGYNGSNEIFLKVNGGAKQTSAVTGIFNTTAPFIIGNRRDLATPHDGVIDEVGYWNRYLTDDELTEIYNAGSGWTHPAAAPLFTNYLNGDFEIELLARSANLGDGSNAQGVCFDGTHYYFSRSDELFKYTRSGDTYTLVDSHEVASDDPVSKTQINGLDFADGHLWVGANNYDTEPKLGWIIKYDTDLNWAATYSTGAHHCEGGAWRDGEFWAVFNDWDRVERYHFVEGTWTKIGDYLLPLLEGQITMFDRHGLSQGACWYGDYLITQTHSVNADTQTQFHRWTGTEFEAVQYIPALGANVGQDVSWEVEGEILLFAERDPGGNGQTIVRATFTDNS